MQLWLDNSDMIERYVVVTEYVQNLLKWGSLKERCDAMEELLNPHKQYLIKTYYGQIKKATYWEIVLLIGSAMNEPGFEVNEDWD